MKNSSMNSFSQFRRLFVLILPVSYYFLPKEKVILLCLVFMAAAVFMRYLKSGFKINIKPNFLSNIFSPGPGCIFLAFSCFIAVFFFSRIVALNSMLFIILGNTFADMVSARYGRATEILTFCYACLSASLFLLFFPLVLGWHIALLGCLAGAFIRVLNLPINKDLSVALSSGIIMRLFLF